MFLTDLFRYRTRDSRESREDFLSSCLAELMRRDPEACAAVLAAVGIPGPPLAGRAYSVRTQVGRPHDGAMRWCDILVEVADHPPILLECKVGAVPDRAQVRLYSRLWDTPHVALLAPVDAIRALEAKTWKDAPRGAWQAVWEAIEALPDAGAHTPFRAAVLDLMDHLELAGCPRRSADDLARAEGAWKVQAPLREPMRQAVLALLVKDHLPLPVEEEDPRADGRTQPVWGDGGPLNAYWERYAARDGSYLLGLGLEVQIRQGVGSDDIDWVLSVCPSPTLAPTLKAKAGDVGGWTEAWGWFSRVLGDTGGPETPFAEQLVRAVAEARLWLRQDVVGDLAGRSRVQPEGVGGTGRDFALHLAAGQAWEGAMQAWSQRLMGHVLDGLPAKLPRSMSARRVREGVRIFQGEVERMWFGWEWDLKRKPFWGLTMGWETAAGRRAALEILEAVDLGDQVQAVAHGPDGQSFRIPLSGVDLATSYQRLASVADRLLSEEALADMLRRTQ